MLALATLLLFVQTAGSPSACDACTADEACAPHVEIERNRLPDLEARYRDLVPHEDVGEVTAAEGALVLVAAFARPASRRSASLLAGALTGSALAASFAARFPETAEAV
jgi:hypothetical protein